MLLQKEDNEFYAVEIILSEIARNGSSDDAKVIAKTEDGASKWLDEVIARLNDESVEDIGDYYMHGYF